MTTIVSGEAQSQARSGSSPLALELGAPGSGSPGSPRTDSTAFLLRRIGELERRLQSAQTEAKRQRRRADMWAVRALSKSKSYGGPIGGRVSSRVRDMVANETAGHGLHLRGQRP